jgi:hypothetical protein
LNAGDLIGAPLSSLVHSPACESSVGPPQTRTSSSRSLWRKDGEALAARVVASFETTRTATAAARLATGRMVTML